MKTNLEILDGLIAEVRTAAKRKTKKKSHPNRIEENLKLKKKQELLKRIGNYPTFGLTLEDLKKMRDDLNVRQYTSHHHGDCRSIPFELKKR